VRTAERESWAHGKRYLSTLDANRHYNYIVVMDEITFQWDERKNRENQRKHGVSFEEARSSLGITEYKGARILNPRSFWESNDHPGGEYPRLHPHLSNT